MPDYQSILVERRDAVTLVTLNRLRMADASTPYGAIEALIMQMKETGETIATALGEIAEARD